MKEKRFVFDLLRFESKLSFSRTKVFKTKNQSSIYKFNTLLLCNHKSFALSDVFDNKSEVSFLLFGRL